MTDTFLIPQEDTAAAAIEDINAEMMMFDDWMERYQYIIEMGKKLPEFPLEWQNEQHRVPGCQSQVWLEAEEREGKLYFAGASDATIVQGLVALLLRVYSGRSKEEILKTDPVFLHEMGLVKALSANRGNGVEAMAQAIQKRASV
ncbi:SufE family protein [Swingsia samuiensis]|uniref:SufE family protein n=1 Tax=Swingsia samuiensis TaxID=1293412 RepID=A0A4Y6UK51_9PROT|nr:SufE family protein [Swingsia samuiensis]QDH16385.1 SufE family protein [Swingsia samuiensis]